VSYDDRVSDSQASATDDTVARSVEDLLPCNIVAHRPRVADPGRFHDRSVTDPRDDRTPQQLSGMSTSSCAISMKAPCHRDRAGRANQERVQPRRGTIHGFCASSQASATRPTLAFLRSATLLTRSTRARLASFEARQGGADVALAESSTARQPVCRSRASGTPKACRSDRPLTYRQGAPVRSACMHASMRNGRQMPMRVPWAA